MSQVTFFIPGKPRGKGRPRFTRSGHTYTDDATREYEARIRWAYKSTPGAGFYPKGVPVYVHICICVPVPVSWPAKRRQDALNGVDIPQSKPDIDNVIKAVLDALNTVAWDDDTQVAAVAATRKFVAQGVEGLQVTIEEIGGQA